MAEEQTVTHIHLNQRYRVVIERAASTKGKDGFKVEANSDSLEEVKREAEALYNEAKRVTKVEEVKE